MGQSSFLQSGDKIAPAGIYFHTVMVEFQRVLREYIVDNPTCRLAEALQQSLTGGFRLSVQPGCLLCDHTLWRCKQAAQPWARLRQKWKSPVQ